jgi:hypothetical protein
MNTHTMDNELRPTWRFKSSRAQDIQANGLGESSSNSVANAPTSTNLHGGEQLPQRGTAAWFYAQDLTHPRAAEAGPEAQWMRPLRTI